MRRKMWRTLGLALVAAVAYAPAAHAQHAEVAAAVSAPEASGCGLCHTSHNAGARRFGLRLDGTSTFEATLAPGSEGPGVVSRSCLRCHSTPDVRALQPGFKGRAVPEAAGGKYLSLDLSDDHPVGRVTRSDWLKTPDPAALAQPRARRNPNPISGLGPEAVAVECTTCHDPHDRTSAAPGREEQARLCGSCHDAIRYALRQHTAVACTDCHRLHGGEQLNLLAEPTADLLCRSCHDPALAAVARREKLAALPTAPRGHSQPPDGSCLDCHTVH
jgi:predicted CXXCH cytochrome family protein